MTGFARDKPASDKMARANNEPAGDIPDKRHVTPGHSNSNIDKSNKNNNKEDSASPLPSEPSDFTLFKKAYTELLTRHGIDTKAVAWGVFGKKTKEGLDRVGLDKMVSGLPEWEKDKFNGMDSGFKMTRYIDNLPKYTAGSVKKDTTLKTKFEGKYDK